MFWALVAAVGSVPTVIPYPVSITCDSGNWTLTQTSLIGYQSGCDFCQTMAEFARDRLNYATGYTLNVHEGDIPAGIFFQRGSDQFEAEEYALSMTSDVATITANSRQALVWGWQTLLQLLPAEASIEFEQPKQAEWTAPICQVSDKPRYKWRGALVDTSRHFIEAEDLKRYISTLSRHKLNYFHWHINDDQGWRFESKVFPKLTELGSTRSSSPKRWHPDEQDGEQYGPFFYTQDQIREIIKHAEERGVTVVPEIEIPGHTMSSLTAYPELSCTGGPFNVSTGWGTLQTDLYCAGNDETLKWLEQLFDEVCEVFDNTDYIHIGGDEAPKDKWKQCPKCQQRMKDQGLSTEDQLQVWFMQHFANYLAAKGKKVIGWDDLMSGGIPEGATIMAWHNPEAGWSAARQGHDAILTTWQSHYLHQCQFTAGDPYEYPGGWIHTKTVYTFDPDGSLPEQYKHFVIGVQGSLWTEYIWNITDLEWKTWPREMAVAEVGWTPKEKLSWPRFIRQVAIRRVKDERMLGVNSAPVQIQGLNEWKSGEIPSDNYVTMQWDVTGLFSGQTSLEVGFFFTYGKNAISVKNVKLVQDGKVVASDDHESTASEDSTNCIYSLWNPNFPGDKYYVSAEVKGIDGSDSNGIVCVYSIK